MELLLLLLLLLLLMLLLLFMLVLLRRTPTPGMVPRAVDGTTRSCSRGSVATVTGSAVGFGAIAALSSGCACGVLAAGAATPVAAGACRRTSTATESASRSQLVASPSACAVKS